MSTIGAEMGQLQQLKGTFDKEAQDVERLRAAISKQVGATWWKGPAADRFRNAWHGQFEPSLKSLHNALHEASAEVQRRHHALTQAGS